MAEAPRKPKKLEVLKPSAKLSPAYAEWITVELGKIALTMGEEIRPQRLALMVQLLIEIEPEPLRRALELAPKELKFFPRPAEIFQIAAREECAMEAEHRASRDDAAEEKEFMSMGRREWIAHKLSQIAILTGNSKGLDFRQSRGMVEELIDIEPASLYRAFIRVGRECKRFPTVADILERLPPKRHKEVLMLEEQTK